MWAATAGPVLCHKRSQHNKKHIRGNKEQHPLATARHSLRATGRPSTARNKQTKHFLKSPFHQLHAYYYCIERQDWDSMNPPRKATDSLCSGWKALGNHPDLCFLYDMHQSHPGRCKNTGSQVSLKTYFIGTSTSGD